MDTMDPVYGSGTVLETTLGLTIFVLALGVWAVG